jgi:hypothetical protein
MGSWLRIGGRPRTRKGSSVNRGRSWRGWEGVANCVEADVSIIARAFPHRPRAMWATDSSLPAPRGLRRDALRRPPARRR